MLALVSRRLYQGFINGICSADEGSFMQHLQITKKSSIPAFGICVFLLSESTRITGHGGFYVQAGNAKDLEVRGLN